MTGRTAEGDGGGETPDTPVARLLADPEVKQILADFAAMYEPGMSAQEFLQNWARPQARATARFMQPRTESAGLASRTSREHDSGWAPPIATVGAIAGMLTRGVEIQSVEGAAGDPQVVVSGQVPSSPAHFGGTVTCTVTPSANGSTLSFEVVFPGQLFAWGAGRRLVRDVCAQLPHAADRVSTTEAGRAEELR